MDFKEIVAIGKEMGLEGQDLLDFAHDREQKEVRKVQISSERDERQKERDHLREMKELELKLIHEQKAQELEIESGMANSTMHNGPKAKMPKLPYFNEQKDDMDAYLRRFERFATSMGWPNAEW